MEIGPCKKFHSESLRAVYEEARKTKDYGYEWELYRRLEAILADVDRKMRSAQKRMEQHQPQLSQPELAVSFLFY